MALSLRAHVVFPVDRPPIENGVVTIDGERIVAVGQQCVGDETIDLECVAIMPGFVNAHTHLEFSSLTQPLGAPGISLTEWIRLVIAERGRRNAVPGAAIAAGLCKCLEHGVTTIGEIAACEPAAYAGMDNPDEDRGNLAAEGLDSRLEDTRLHGTTLFAEVIGFSRARANSALAALIARLDEFARAAPHARPGISPHAPYTVSPLLLQQLVELAHNRNLPVAMHLAESVDELEFLDSGTGPFQQLLDERSMWDAEVVPPGTRPLDYLRLLADGPRSLVIHGNYLDAAEREWLATHRNRMSLVYCPRTHAYFDHEPYPLTELFAAGVKVVLGTDSRASNPDLNLLAEMRCVARSYPTIEPLEILRMGTMGGAEALGLGDDAGSLTSGKLANLVALPLPIEAVKTPTNALAAILDHQIEPHRVWLRGWEMQP